MPSFKKLIKKSAEFRNSYHQKGQIGEKQFIYMFQKQSVLLMESGFFTGAEAFNRIPKKSGKMGASFFVTIKKIRFHRYDYHKKNPNIRLKMPAVDGNQWNTL